jgi:putative ABC transport system ATP-binding protein
LILQAIDEWGVWCPQVAGSLYQPCENAGLCRHKKTGIPLVFGGRVRETHQAAMLVRFTHTTNSGFGLCSHLSASENDDSERLFTGLDSRTHGGKFRKLALPFHSQGMGFAAHGCVTNHQHSAMTMPSASRTNSASVQSGMVFFAQGVTKVYQMGAVEVHALRGVDLELFAGEFIVILGASGSGKSTLLNILGGLDIPTAGLVSYKDHELAGADERTLTRFRRDHVGFVFQYPNLMAGLTAVQNVALVTDIADNPLDPYEALEIVGLADRVHHYPSQLSGGEQQRVAIARAIGKRPDVLLCDEPTGALDVKTGILVLAAISNINRELGTLTVAITHNSSIAAIADRVIRLSDGRITGITRTEKKKSASELAW